MSFKFYRVSIETTIDKSLLRDEQVCWKKNQIWMVLLFLSEQAWIFTFRTTESKITCKVSGARKYKLFEVREVVGIKVDSK